MILSQTAQEDSVTGVATRLFDRVPKFRLLGTAVSIISVPQILKLFEVEWTVNRRDRYVVLRDVHGIMRARSDAKLQKDRVIRSDNS